MPGDDRIDDLYTLPLDEFTAARNALARELRQSGDKQAAEAVKGLAKPSLSAWIVNQLARKRAGDVKALLEAGERARKARSADELRQASADASDSVRALVGGARELLAEAGRPAGDTLLARVAATLQAAAAEEESRELLEAGRLTADLEPASFGAFAGVSLAPAPPARRKEARVVDRTAVFESKRRAHELRSEATRLAREADAAEEAAERARQAAEEADRAAAEAEAEASRLAASARRDTM